MIAENPNAAQAPNATGANKHPGVKKGVKGFLKGKSGNPAGRPPGSRCQATLMAQALFDDKGRAIVDKIIELALKKGDLTELKLCIDRILPLLKSRHVHFTLQEIRTAKDSMQDLLDYAAGIQERFQRWWETAGRATDFDQPGKVYYGEVTLLEVLERTGWHSGQHTRQLALVLESLGLEPDGPLTDADFAGLPMPNQVWDNEKTFD